MSTTATRPTGRYESATAVRAAHTALLAAMPDCPDADDLTRAADFIAAAAATGTVLDAPDDRKLVQGLIDYWAASLQCDFRHSPQSDTFRTSRVKPATTVLAEFDRKQIPAAVARAEAWLSGLDDADRRTVQRILLRLVRLQPAGRTFDSVPAVRAALNDVAPQPETVDRLLDGLVEAGVVRRLAGDLPGNEQVALRTAELMTTWPTLAAWLGERVRFRDAATGWADEKAHAAQRRVSRTVDVFDQWLAHTLSKFGRSVDRLVTPTWLGLRRRSGLATPTDRLLGGDALEDARTYHDRNLVEREFTDASRYQQQLAGDRNRVLMGLFGLATIAASVFLLSAVMSGVGWKREADEARLQRDVALENQRLVGVRRTQAIERQLLLESRESDLEFVLDRVINKPDEIGEIRNGPRGMGFQNRLAEIKHRRDQVAGLQNPDAKSPLHPGCRVWLVPIRDGSGNHEDPSICSVCCIVRPADRADTRRFAVAFCSPVSRGKPVTVRRGTLEGPEIGSLVNPDSMRRDTASVPNDLRAKWIALVELRVPAENAVPLIGRPLAGATTTPGDSAILIGGTSGESKVHSIDNKKSPLLTYAVNTAIIGDAGGPVVDQHGQLLAMHMVSADQESQGYLIAPWLEAHGLELDLPTSK